jgi:LPXTG-motif cell wall-anchored protein
MTITRRLAALGATAALAVMGVVGFAAAASASAAPRPAGVSVQRLAEGATMSVKPSTINAGDSTTVSGTGCLGLRDIQPVVDIAIEDATGENVVATASATPDGNGAWTTDVEVDTAGDFTVFVSCDDYVNDPEGYPSQPLTVNPVVTTSTTTTSTTTSASTTSESIPTVSTVVTTSKSPSQSASSTTSEAPASSSTAATTTSAACDPSITLVNYTGSVSQGGSLGVDLTCFQPGEKIQVFLHSDPVLLTTLISDDSGNASGTVTIPLDAAIGAHTITVVGEISGISLEAPIMVEAAVETTATAPLTQTSTSAAQPVEVVTTTTLANTGTNAAAMTIWGVVLLAVGGIVVALTRKRGGKHVGD